MIGLASGSWAQVIAANQEEEDFAIVEINPAYLQLIPRYPDVPVCCIIPRCGL
jgi:spermidine synthase